MNDTRRKDSWQPWAAALALAFLSCNGCALYHSLGTGVRYDPPPDREVSEKSKRVRDILIEVTTNASGAVTQVDFKRSSGDPDMDKYIADSVRAEFTAGGVSTRSLVELTYSGEKGFSDPKVLSTKPAP